MVTSSRLRVIFPGAGIRQARQVLMLEAVEREGLIERGWGFLLLFGDLRYDL